MRVRPSMATVMRRTRLPRLLVSAATATTLVAAFGWGTGASAASASAAQFTPPTATQGGKWQR
jgi:hypothetical protein